MGDSRERSRSQSERRSYFDQEESFRNPPLGPDLPPSASAPATYRGILAEVRAPFPPVRPNHTSRTSNALAQSKMSRRVQRPIQPNDWIPKITVGQRQEGSNSAPTSGKVSRASSRSMHDSADDLSVPRNEDAHENGREREPDREQILHDELVDCFCIWKLLLNIRLGSLAF